MLRQVSHLAFRVLVALAALWVLGMFMITTGIAQEVPKDAPVIGMTSLPCGGVLVYYDSDGKPENGAEYIAVQENLEGAPLAILEAAPGDGGAFIRAVVRIPGQPEATFDSHEAFVAAYPTACRIILESQAKRPVKTHAPVTPGARS